jgi:D-glycero-alpha-D-manno-heptose-7-phosphate kinase
MIFRARAPLRISFAGGGTDLSPYVNQHGGLVLSTTIDRYAHATIRICPEPVIRVRSLDFGAVLDINPHEPPPFDGNLDLVKGCLRRLSPADTLEHGIELVLDTDAPPGSGLGASSALVVATIGALAEWRRLRLDRYQLARLAWEIERKDVGVPGGLQDQFAAAFGGFNLIEFRSETDVVVNPLRVETRILNELAYNMLLVYTGATRVSAKIIEAQISGLTEQRAGVKDAMDEMKQLTLDAKDALLQGRLGDFARILHQEWLAKKKTSDAVTTARIEELYDESRRLGALGGKISGAGGGGFMFLYCPFDSKHHVTKRLAELGADVLPIAFGGDGMQSWAWADSGTAGFGDPSRP